MVAILSQPQCVNEALQTALTVTESHVIPRYLFPYVVLPLFSS